MKLEVVAAFLEKGNGFLLCRRPMHKARGGQWEFPGGKIEPGETPTDAIARELQEELGIRVRGEGVLAQVTHTYQDLRIHLSLIRTVLLEGEPQLLEHSALCWVTIEDAKSLNICAADRLLLAQIEGRIPYGISE